jgi:hypothetical protein
MPTRQRSLTRHYTEPGSRIIDARLQFKIDVFEIAITVWSLLTKKRLDTNGPLTGGTTICTWSALAMPKPTVAWIYMSLQPHEMSGRRRAPTPPGLIRESASDTSTPVCRTDARKVNTEAEPGRPKRRSRRQGTGPAQLGRFRSPCMGAVPQRPQILPGDSPFQPEAIGPTAELTNPRRSPWWR